VLKERRARGVVVCGQNVCGQKWEWHGGALCAASRIASHRIAPSSHCIATHRIASHRTETVRERDREEEP